MHRVLTASIVALAAGCAPAPDPVAPDWPTDTPEGRGRYLVEHVVACPACHSPRDAEGAPIPGLALSGWECFQRRPDGSCLNPRNLTSAPLGLANRTDDEIARMFLDGVRPLATGDAPIHPTMPYWRLHGMAPGDAAAIVAYLRTVPPVDRFIPRSGPGFDVPAPAPALDLASVPMGGRGRTLAVQAGCIDCHTPLATSGSVLDPSRYFRGGRVVTLPPPFGSAAAPDLTALAGWTVADVVAALTTGKGREGRAACPPPLAGPDGAFAGLHRDDAEAIAGYLLSLRDTGSRPSHAVGALTLRVE